MEQTLTAEPSASEPTPRRRRKVRGTVLLWFFAAPYLVWVAIAPLGLDGNRYTVALAALTQYAVPFGVLLMLTALAMRRWLTTLAVVLASMLLISSVAPRVLPDAPRPVHGTPVHLLSLNGYYGRVDAERVVGLVREHDVDVLSLQELTPGLVSRLDRAGLAELLPHRMLRPGANGSGLASRYPLRELDLVHGTTMPHPSARARLPGDRAMDIVAVHPLYPMGRDTVPRWDRDLAALPDPSRGGPPRVLAGDFNATLEHTRMRDLLGRGYVDAAQAAGRGLHPTWPMPGRWLPPPVTIDHVLTSGPVAMTDYRTFEVSGSDHRAIYTRLVVEDA